MLPFTLQSPDHVSCCISPVSAAWHWAACTCRCLSYSSSHVIHFKSRNSQNMTSPRTLNVCQGLRMWETMMLIASTRCEIIQDAQVPTLPGRTCPYTSLSTRPAQNSGCHTVSLLWNAAYTMSSKGHCLLIGNKNLLQAQTLESDVRQGLPTISGRPCLQIVKMKSFLPASIS